MELKDAIEGRRSHRRYRDQPVDDGLIEQLIRTAVWAPSAMNVQPWFFRVINRPDAMVRVRALMHKAGVLLTPSLEARFQSHPEVIKETHTFMDTLGGAPACIFVFLNKEYEGRAYTSMIQSTAACMQNFCLLAYENGLSTCWITGTDLVEDELREEFGKGLGQFVAVIALGYSDQKPVGPVRRPNRYDFVE